MVHRFLHTVNVWTATDEELAALLPGQWVSAGEPDATRSNCGRWYGITKGGTKVAAWNGNARRADCGWKAYHQKLHRYAQGD